MDGAWGAARQGEDPIWCPRAAVPAHKLEELPSPACPGVEGGEGH